MEIDGLAYDYQIVHAVFVVKEAGFVHAHDVTCFEPKKELVKMANCKNIYLAAVAYRTVLSVRVPEPFRISTGIHFKSNTVAARYALVRPSSQYFYCMQSSNLNYLLPSVVINTGSRLNSIAQIALHQTKTPHTKLAIRIHRLGLPGLSVHYFAFDQRSWSTN